jgi:hypothetical protein
MFGPRTVLSTTSLLRSFSSLAVAYRCPSIRDITVESTEEFLRRQKEFRETVKQVRLRKQQQESQSINALCTFFYPSIKYAPTAPRVSTAGIYKCYDCTDMPFMPPRCYTGRH